MTSPMRARRMRWLLATLVAVPAMAAILRWSAARVDAVSTTPRIVARANGSVVLDGVSYRPTREVLARESQFHQIARFYRACAEASDPGSGERLWKVTIREGTQPEIMPSMHYLPAVDPVQFLDQFALKLSARGREIAAETPDGGIYLVDPATRQVRRVRAPSPPPEPPVLDARRPGETRCEVHDRALREGVVPILYGLIKHDPGAYEIRRTRFPHADSWVGGGCAPGKSREARVRYCPECREAEREWLRSIPVRRRTTRTSRTG